MAPSKQNDRDARQARERLRAYQARQTVHEEKVKRRRRDNWIGGIAVIVIVALAIGTQAVALLRQAGRDLRFGVAVPVGLDGGGRPVQVDRRGTHLDGRHDHQRDQARRLAGRRRGPAGRVLHHRADAEEVHGLSCHRLTTSGIYVLQCGDPKGDGTGGPGYSYGPIENAPKDDKYPAGTLAMARQSGNAASQGSQFFIVYKDSTIPSDSAGGYTVLGKITSGLDTLMTDVTDKGVQGGGTDGKPAVTTKIDSFTLQ